MFAYDIDGDALLEIFAGSEKGEVDFDRDAGREKRGSHPTPNPNPNPTHNPNATPGRYPNPNPNQVGSEVVMLVSGCSASKWKKGEP